MSDNTDPRRIPLTPSTDLLNQAPGQTTYYLPSRDGVPIQNIRQLSFIMALDLTGTKTVMLYAEFKSAQNEPWAFLANPNNGVAVPLLGTALTVTGTTGEPIHFQLVRVNGANNQQLDDLQASHLRIRVELTDVPETGDRLSLIALGC